MLEVMFIGAFVVVGMNWTLTLNFLCLMFIFFLLEVYDDGVYLVKLIMILLSLWLVMMMFFSVEFNEQKFVLKLMFMMVLYFLEVVFYSDSLIMFYIGFEASVIPILLIIFGWGYQPDRLEAGFYMIMYTVFFSLPLLLSIFLWEFMLISMNSIILVFLLAFLVKFPLFGLHLWLTRAHVEAPVYGSMILAGVMLKLGGYGLFKISFLGGDLILFSSEWLIVYSIFGGVILSMICFMQSDMKVLIAYSSIIHMSLVLSGILTMSELGMNGGIYMMVGHGLCSSGLFCMLGFVYNRTNSRSIYVNKGLLTVLPVGSLWWFMFCMGNISFPPSLNLAGELCLFITLVGWDSLIVFLLIFLSFLSSMYSIYLYSFSQHGLFCKNYSFNSFSLRESLVMFLHWIPLNVLMLDLSFLSFY
uniref:NADH-ubiquinone oxidoreductase chain 4 n=1 Tax=Homotoma ficus TaxID=2218120 RepID=A0A344A2F2_9HEMI|nr:NADH dehydrogenase subunit 4 [Homotoma ficus]AWU48943.1 NADH dehydrogenase subunit 4 [Homotoma ficus]